ncbi:short-chain dehydrogenase [Mycobacterium marinum]|nr:short-chain dehydrogenase [Mycobacterium marinum]
MAVIGKRRAYRVRVESATFLIVGGSSGIGRSVAERAARRGATVAVTARRTDRLASLAATIAEMGGSCSIHPADATDPVAAQSVVADVLERHGKIDVVLLNAGGAPALDLTRLDAADITSVMDANYDVAVNYLVPVLRHMAERGTGVIAHTNSLAGWYAVPLQGPYSAAKAALRVLFDAYRIEYAGSGVRFVSIYPGFVATEATEGDGMPAPGEISEQEAAEHVLRALSSGRESYSFPRAMSTLVGLGRLLPTTLRRKVIKKVVTSA